MAAIDIVKESLWQQFGASIEMLKNAIVMWPEDAWKNNPKGFHMAYHTLFFLEYYLTNPPLNFKPTLEAERDDDDMPKEIFSKKEILEYLEECRAKCRQVIDGLNENNLDRRWIQPERWPRNYNAFELLMYNMRHVQHHAAQMNMMLRNQINDSPDWVSRASGGA